MPIDISEYLNLVRTGTGVNDVRRGIAGGVDEIAKYLGASGDISQELYDIKNGVYGKDIRAAIYSALDKLSKKEGGGGTNVVPSITDDFHRVEENMLMGTVTSSFAFAKDGYSYWNQSSEQNRNNVSVSVSTDDSKGTLLAVCMSRSTATIDGDGWTKIAESVHCSSSGVEQWITVWRKDINSAYSGTVMARQTEVGPMRICVFAFYGFDIRFDVAGNTTIESFPYTPVAKTGKRRLYLASIIRSGYQEGIWTDASLVKLASTQFSVFLDYNAGGTDTPVLTTPETGYQAGAAVCLTLDITVDGT